jgi:hypothetical protein
MKMQNTIAVVVIENDPATVESRNGKIAVITYVRWADDDYEQVDHVEFNNFRDAQCAAEGVARRNRCEWMQTHPAADQCPN